MYASISNKMIMYFGNWPKKCIFYEFPIQFFSFDYFLYILLRMCDIGCMHVYHAYCGVNSAKQKVQSFWPSYTYMPRIKCIVTCYRFFIIIFIKHQTYDCSANQLFLNLQLTEFCKQLFD